MAAALGAEIFSRGFRFLPTPQDAVTYYLPRLVAGEPLHDAVRAVVHRADVYAAACAPADLARRFRPLPRTGDRFFFTPSTAASRKRAGAGQARAAGSWHAQSTTDIVDRRGGDVDGDAKVGELRKLRYKKSGGVYTDWLMDEYSACSVAAGAGDGECQFALCRMYVSPRASPASSAHQESAAYFFQQLPPQHADVVMPAAPAAAAAAAAPKRPAPPQPPMSPPCAKRMRAASVLPAPPPPPRPPAPPVPDRHAAQLHRSPMPLPLPTPRRPLAQPKKEEVPWLPTPPVAMASASDTPQQAPAPAPPPCQPQIFVQPKQRMTIVDPFEAAMQAEQQTVAAAAPDPPPPPLTPPPTATPTPALQDEEEEDDRDDLEKALGIEDATPGLRDQDDDWDDLDKLLGI